MHYGYRGLKIFTSLALRFHDFQRRMSKVLSHDSAVFDTASRLRAETGMKLIDALHYATALKAGCKFFITNDTGIRSTDTLEVILLKNCRDN